MTDTHNAERARAIAKDLQRREKLVKQVADYTYPAIANRWGVSKQTVINQAMGRSWKNLEDK